jgi:hypothetical protein
MTPGFMYVDYHIHSSRPVFLIGMGSGLEQALFHPFGQGTDMRIIVVQ